MHGSGISSTVDSCQLGIPGCSGDGRPTACLLATSGAPRISHSVVCLSASYSLTSTRMNDSTTVTCCRHVSSFHMVKMLNVFSIVGERPHAAELDVFERVATGEYT